MAEITDFKVGTRDISGNLITKVFSVGDSYIIYEIETNIVSESIKVLINPNNEDQYKEHEENYNKIKPLVNEIKAILFKTSRENSFKHLIAPAISIGIIGEVEKSEKMLSGIKERIETEYKEQFNNKLVFMFSVLILVLACLLISYLVFIGKLSFLSDYFLIKLFVYSSTASTLGGFISLSYKLKDLQVEKDLSKRTFVLYGIERISISIVSSIIVVIVIKSRLIFGFMDDQSFDTWVYLSLSVLAGFSERFVPDLLNKIEEQN